METMRREREKKERKTGAVAGGGEEQKCWSSEGWRFLIPWPRLRDPLQPRFLSFLTPRPVGLGIVGERWIEVFFFSFLFF